MTRGRLIVFEGLDGAGKSTQIELLRKYLTQLGYAVVMTGWNSSRLISKAIKRAKKARLLTPHLYSALHAADFMYRLEHVILPALHEGYVVLADRYAYTGLARDLARGIDRGWVEQIYSLSLKPDLAFYCRAPIEEALARILESGRVPAYYESGMDVHAGGDPVGAYRAFQGRVASEYDWICRSFGLVDVDTAGSIEAVHRRIAETVDEKLKAWEGDAPPLEPFGSGALAAPREDAAQHPVLPSLPPHRFPGKFIVIEGPDESVRRRQATLLYNEIIARGHPARLALLNRSWVGIEVARKALRKTVLTLPTRILLAAAETALYYEQVIVPALSAGETVVADGYLATIFVRSIAAGIAPAWWSSIFTGIAVSPDLTCYCDAPLAAVTAVSPEDLLSLSPAAADRQAILAHYRMLADAGGWTKVPAAPTDAEAHRVLAPAALALLPAEPPAGARPDETLRAVFAALARYDDDDTHPRKVAELAVELYDQTAEYHGGGERERRLLVYAAYLHDIGHALSEKRHEEFTYEAIMRESFAGLSDGDREIVANVACLHRLPYAKMKFDHLARLSGAKQLVVKQLAALLRIADALDESGKLVVRGVRCYEEHGVVTIDLHAVSKALPERAAVLRKADMFERVFRKPVVVARNWLEKRERQAARSPKTAGGSAQQVQ